MEKASKKSTRHQLEWRAIAACTTGLRGIDSDLSFSMRQNTDSKIYFFLNLFWGCYGAVGDRVAMEIVFKLTWKWYCLGGHDNRETVVLPFPQTSC